PKMNAIWSNPGFGVKWLQALVAGVVFIAALMVVQWPFATFLMSPASRNWVFGTMNHPYMASPDWYGVRNVFWQYEQTAGHFWANMAWALVVATLCTRLGIMFGNWMRKVQR
ncbi:MAG TPA: hypothetical protein VIX19_15090, partial [Terriglobales bacterium]